jgi:hypothetical protein
VGSRTNNGDFGGLQGADALCQSLADEAGLRGTYMAWLSDASGSPLSRFRHSNQPYVLVGGAQVAESWDDLTTRKPNGRFIARPINRSETGDDVLAGQVWTNTNTDGSQADATRSCGGWADATGPPSGPTGVVGNLGALSAQGAEWTRGVGDNGCNSSLRFYCFQQE